MRVLALPCCLLSVLCLVTGCRLDEPPPQSPPPPAPPPAPAPPGSFTSFPALLDATKKRAAELGGGRFAIQYGSDGTGMASGEGSYEQSANEISFEAQLAANGVALRFVSVRDRVYVRLPDDLAPQPGRPWTAIDPKATDEFSTQLGGVAKTVRELLRPTAALASAGRITGITEDRFGAEPVTRYSFVLDATTLRDAAEPQYASGPEAALQAGAAELPGEALVRKDNVMAQFSMTLYRDAERVTATLRTLATTPPPDIAPPPPAEQSPPPQF